MRALLPGAPGCLALVTSRDQLTGLAAAGAHPVGVDLLDDAEARAMLRARLGADRVDAEPATVDEIIGLCARLPLALAVVAARAAAHPGFSLEALAGQLREARGSLDEFAGADPATDPRAVFSWSYLRLTPAAARLFRLLGPHTGPDVSARAAASLAGLPARAVRPLLAELAQSHLIAEPVPGRYTCHDLLRAYAAELADEEETPAEREAAVHRLLGHYAHTAYLADGFLGPWREVPPPLTPLPPGAEPAPIRERDQALAWFRAEHRVLLAAIRQDTRFDREMCDLARWTHLFLDMAGHWHDEFDLLSVGLSAARRLGDDRMRAYMHCHLGRTHIWFSRHPEGAADLQEALDLYRKTNDIVGQAYTHYSFAWLLDRQRAVSDALTHAEQALDLFRAAGHQAGQAKALNAVGWFHTLLGRQPTAIKYCQEALELQTRLDDHLAAAQTWHSLGYIHKEIGDAAKAVSCYESATELYHRHGYPISKARVLLDLADLHDSLGDDEAAHAGWQRAHDVLTGLTHPDTDEVRALLAQIHSRQSTRQE